jgi:uncharacterized protein
MTGPNVSRADLSPRQVVEIWQACALARDLSAEADLYAEDGVWEAPFNGSDSRVEGRENIRSMLLKTQQAMVLGRVHPEGYKSVVWHETNDPEVVIVELEVYGKIGRKDFCFPYIQVFRVRNGEVVHVRDYYTSGTTRALARSILRL